MAKKKMKRTYTGTTSVITTRRTSDDSVTVFKDTYTDRETTFRKEQPGVFGILTSMTTYVIIFMLLLFGTSAIHYENNQESLSWIDANGEFKTSSYDVTVSYNLDTSLDELNGNSLNQVFRDNNDLVNGDFSDSYNGWGDTSATVSVINGRAKIIADTQFPRIYQTIMTPYKTYWYYAEIEFEADGVFSYIPKIRSTFLNFYYPYSVAQAGELIHAYGINSLGNDTLYRIDLYTNIDDIIYLDNCYAINLSDLGLTNLTEDEMYYWYTEYQRLQVNMLEDLKTLGAMPLASWNTINEVTRSLIDVYEFGMKLVFPIVDVVRRLISLV